MNMNTSQAYEEIDLLELVIRIYKFFKKRILLIVATTVICIGAGSLSSYLIFQPRYQSTMIFKSRSISIPEAIGIFNDLDKLVKEENYAEFSRLTNVPIKIAKNVKKIYATPNHDIQKIEPKKEESAIALTIETIDNENLDKIQQGIVSYFENLPYVQKSKKLFKESKEKILAQVRKEIRHIDSVRKIIEAIPLAKNYAIIEGLNNFSDKLDIYNAEAETIEELSYPDDIRIIKDFTCYQKPSKFSIKDILGTSALIGFILGILWGLIIELNKLIRQREASTSL